MTNGAAMLLTDLVAGLAILLYLGTALFAGSRRHKYGVKSPAVTGHPIFERALRVQNNTLEQIVPFLPALWLYSSMVDARSGAAFGLVWVIGRLLYWVSYMRDPDKRGPGFGVSFLALLVLLIGGMAGAVAALIQGGA